MTALTTIHAPTGSFHVGAARLSAAGTRPRLVAAAVLLTLFPAVTASAQTEPPSRALLNRPGVTFIENRGQWDAEARFLVRIGGLDAWVTDTGVLFDFYEHVRPERRTARRAHRSMLEADQPFGMPDNSDSRRGHVIRMQFESSAAAAMVGRYRQNGYHNYFIGSDPSRWASEVPLYGEVTISELYDGIGMRLYDDGGFLRYDLIMQPGADIAQVRLRIEGAGAVHITPEGDLAMETALGEVRQAGLLAYQEIQGCAVSVPAAFRLLGIGLVGFDVVPLEPSLALVIDPLIYSTFLGGSTYDSGSAIAVDADGNAFVTGRTRSTDFPTTEGAYETGYPGESAAFVTKLNAGGADLAYSTFIGGSANDSGKGLAVDAAGNAFVTGNTWSADFPTTEGTFHTLHPGGSAAFVTKLNADGSALIYSTFLGGSGVATGRAIAVDGLGNGFVAGGAFVTKLNADGTGLVYSIDLGGSGNAIAVDAAGHAFVTGVASSTDFPTTQGAFQMTHPGGFSAAFVTKLNADGTGRVYSTFLGGSGDDAGYAIAVDADGHAFITGHARSIDFPTTAGAFQESRPRTWPEEETFSAFVTKLNTDGTGLVYSTYLAGGASIYEEPYFIEDPGYDFAYAIAVDAFGNAHMTGSTTSANFPTTAGAFQETHPGLESAFVTTLNADGTGLVYSTYLGGGMGFDEEPGEDVGLGIAVDDFGNPYVTGRTNSIDFPTTAGSYQTAHPRLQDAPSLDVDFIDAAFVTKLQLDAPLRVELAELSARVENRDVRLTWRTGSESNSAGFQVEMLRDGVFQAVGFVERHGSTARAEHYVFVVRGLSAGRHQFRLKQIGFDGTISYSPVVGAVIEVAGTYELSAAYPNPFNPTTNLTLTVAREQWVKVEVFDMLGRRVALLFDGIMSGDEGRSLRFDGAALPGGVYTYRAEGEFFRATRRMVLLK